MEISARVGRFFLSCKVPTDFHGYHYAKECIAYVIRNDCPECNKVLFFHVAEKYHVEAQNVERCIRTFINNTWKKLPALFAARPSSRELILKCAEHIKSLQEPSTSRFTYCSAYDILDC